jgi:hypothetical protein
VILLEGLSQLYLMLGALEQGMLSEAEDRRAKTVEALSTTAGRLDDIANAAGDYSLKESTAHPYGLELADLYSRLALFGYTLPLINSELSRINALEVRKVLSTIDGARFQGSPNDWRVFRSVIESTNRMLDVGMITSRISALHGHRPPPA